MVAMTSFAANSLLARLALREGEIDAGSFAAVRIFAGTAMLALIVTCRQEGISAIRNNGSRIVRGERPQLLEWLGLRCVSGRGPQKRDRSVEGGHGSSTIEQPQRVALAVQFTAPVSFCESVGFDVQLHPSRPIASEVRHQLRK
jgi:hypothetical protein